MNERRDRARGILAWCRCAGVTLHLKDGQPRARFPDDPNIDVKETMAEIKGYRDEIVTLLGERHVPYVPCLDDPVQ